MLIKKESKKILENISGKKCSICNNYFSHEDITNKNYEVVVSKISKRKSYYHSNCILKKGGKNG